MTYDELKKALLQIADDCSQKGPGFAQQSVVLRTAAEQLGFGGDLEKQKFLLTVWHDLFRSGDLSWGFDLSNPSAPFFHRPNRVMTVATPASHLR